MRTGGCFIGLALLAAPAVVFAGPLEPGPPPEEAVEDEGRQPVPYSERPLTLPELTLAPELGFNATHYDFGLAALDVFSLSAGASFGIIDDLTVEVVPLSLVFGDVDFDYGYFLTGITYRFLDGIVDMGARFRFAIDSSPNLFFNPGIPVRIRTEIVRVDTGVEIAIIVPDDRLAFSRDVYVGLQGFGQHIYSPTPGIPALVALQVIDYLWLGLNTGFGIADFSEAGDTSFLPLGWAAGGTIPDDDDDPILDISAGFSFPLFVISASEAELPITEIWQLGAEITGYLYF